MTLSTCMTKLAMKTRPIHVSFSTINSHSKIDQKGFEKVPFFSFFKARDYDIPSHGQTSKEIQDLFVLGFFVLFLQAI